MQIPFVLYRFFVFCRLLRREQIIVTALRKRIVFEPGGMLPLFYVKIRSVLLPPRKRLERIDAFVFVIQSVEIQEVGDLDLLIGP